MLNDKYNDEFYYECFLILIEMDMISISQFL